MNVVCLNLQNYDAKNFYFFDSKPNHIIDGTFSKIMYTDKSFTMNGLYIYIPLKITSTQKIDNNKYNIFIDIDENILNLLKRMEIELLYSYSYTKQIKKECDNGLFRQLIQKKIRIYESFNRNIQDSYFLLKISGVWESETKYGITHKFLEAKII